jgi:hypothetical protein
MSRPDTNTNNFAIPKPKTLALIPRDSVQEESKPKKKDIVLDEEEHIKNLSKIINRDFFPLLHQIENQEKSEAGDASTNLSARMTTVTNPEVDEMTLNAYLATYNR